MHVLTLIAPPGFDALTPALIARMTEAVHGGTPVVLSPGEAVDIPVAAPPDPAVIHAALDAAPVDAVVTPVANRRKRTSVAPSNLVQAPVVFAAASGVAAVAVRSINAATWS